MWIIKNFSRVFTLCFFNVLTLISTSSPVYSFAWGDSWIFLGTRSANQCLDLARTSLNEAGANSVQPRLGQSYSGSINGSFVVVLCTPDGENAIIFSDTVSACNAVYSQLIRFDNRGAGNLGGKHC